MLESWLVGIIVFGFGVFNAWLATHLMARRLTSRDEDGEPGPKLIKGRWYYVLTLAEYAEANKVHGMSLAEAREALRRTCDAAMAMAREANREDWRAEAE